MKEKMCCIVGVPLVEAGTEAQVKEKIRTAIKMQVQRGAEYFQCGAQRGFDLLAAQAVLDESESNHDIKLFVVRPTPHQTKDWIKQDKEQLNRILNAAKGRFYVRQEGDMRSEEAVRREMMYNSNYCIAYHSKADKEISACVDYIKRSGANTISIN